MTDAQPPARPPLAPRKPLIDPATRSMAEVDQVEPVPVSALDHARKRLDTVNRQREALYAKIAEINDRINNLPSLREYDDAVSDAARKVSQVKHLRGHVYLEKRLAIDPDSVHDPIKEAEANYAAKTAERDMILQQHDDLVAERTAVEKELSKNKYAQTEAIESVLRCDPENYALLDRRNTLKAELFMVEQRIEIRRKWHALPQPNLQNDGLEQGDLQRFQDAYAAAKQFDVAIEHLREDAYTDFPELPTITINGASPPLEQPPLGPPPENAILTTLDDNGRPVRQRGPLLDPPSLSKRHDPMASAD